MISDLMKQYVEMRQSGKVPTTVEVGPQTWKMLIDTAEAGTKKKWPRWQKAAKEGYFCGMKVVEGRVPENRLWPVEY